MILAPHHQAFDLVEVLNSPEPLFSTRAARWVMADGSTPTPREFRKWLQGQIRHGRLFWPVEARPCEGWTFRKGCPGHEPGKAGEF